MVFLGEYSCPARGGRLTIPAEFRTGLGGGLVLTRGIEDCLVIYPIEEWQNFVEKVRSRLPITSHDARAFKRLVFSAAVFSVPDQRGRIPLPDDLRRYAGIEDEAVFVGLCACLEVWSPQRWQETALEVVRQGTAVAERLSHLGI
ncbi:MAG TPA: division/cell wall cluster transcriptional repressor MraZ [Anaerolineae bacterium]|nr:division/cell wall cluster transcriptional repressor MraZ [Anaerolineae bacterium]